MKLDFDVVVNELQLAGERTGDVRSRQAIHDAILLLKQYRVAYNEMMRSWTDDGR